MDPSVSSYIVNLQRRAYTHSRVRWLLYAIAANNIAVGASAPILCVLLSSFRSIAWQEHNPEYNASLLQRFQFLLRRECALPAPSYRYKTFANASAAWNAFSDFALAALPLYILAGRRIPQRLETTLCVLRGLGCSPGLCALASTCIMSALKDKANFTSNYKPTLLFLQVVTALFEILESD